MKKLFRREKFTIIKKCCWTPYSPANFIICVILMTFFGSLHCPWKLKRFWKKQYKIKLKEMFYTFGCAWTWMELPEVMTCSLFGQCVTSWMEDTAGMCLVVVVHDCYLQRGQEVVWPADVHFCSFVVWEGCGYASLVVCWFYNSEVMAANGVLGTNMIIWSWVAIEIMYAIKLQTDDL